MSTALLSLGSNIDARANLRSALAALRARFGPLRLSPVYRTRAVGFEGADFLNAGVAIETDLPPQALNDWLHGLEDAHGRDRSGPRFNDRTLDIDIVLFDDLVAEGAGNLRIPRDELRHAFVLRPLADIVPEFIEPGSGRTLGELWRAHAEHDRDLEVVDLDDAAAA